MYFTNHTNGKFLPNFRELLLDFYTSSGKQKPDQIIIFRYVYITEPKIKWIVVVFSEMLLKTMNLKEMELFKYLVCNLFL